MPALNIWYFPTVVLQTFKLKFIIPCFFRVSKKGRLYVMKRCPSCNNTFDDNLRFCQNDGTPLLDEPVDPFQTMVAGKPEDDPLQIPDYDPNKTAVFSARDEMDVLSTPPPPSFGDLGSLPSPEPESF